MKTLPLAYGRGGSREQHLMTALMSCPVLAKLDEQALQTLAFDAHVKRYATGEILFRNAAPATHAWLLISPGWVKLVRETLEGREVVWGVLGEGDLVGMEGMLAPFVHEAQAVTVSPVEALMLNVHTLRRLGENTPGLMTELATLLMQKNKNMLLEMEHRTHQSAAQRIGCFLLNLAPTDGKVDKVEVTLPYDKSLLAAKLGMQPETFSRGLAKLKQDVPLTLRGTTVALGSLQILSAYVCGACTGSYPCTSGNKAGKKHAC